MPLDFVETNPFGAGAGQVAKYVANIADIVSAMPHGGTAVECHRTSATDLPFRDASFDAVVTDPPYYDNISYADLSDFFYVWLKRSIGFIGDEFTGELTPKRRETVMASHRHGGNKLAARHFYESEMAAAFAKLIVSSNRAHPSSVYTRTRRRWGGLLLLKRCEWRDSPSRRLGRWTPRCRKGPEDKAAPRLHPPSSLLLDVATTKRLVLTTRSSRARQCHRRAPRAAHACGGFGFRSRDRDDRRGAAAIHPARER